MTTGSTKRPASLLPSRSHAGAARRTARALSVVARDREAPTQATDRRPSVVKPRRWTQHHQRSGPPSRVQTKRRKAIAQESRLRLRRRTVPDAQPAGTRRGRNLPPASCRPAVRSRVFPGRHPTINPNPGRSRRARTGSWRARAAQMAPARGAAVRGRTASGRERAAPSVAPPLAFPSDCQAFVEAPESSVTVPERTLRRAPLRGD